VRDPRVSPVLLVLLSGQQRVGAAVECTTPRTKSTQPHTHPQGLVDWLTDVAGGGPHAADFRAAAGEEGLFIALPHRTAWFVEQQQQADNAGDNGGAACPAGATAAATDACDGAADDAMSALDRLLADSAAGPAPMDTDDDAAAAAHAQQQQLDGKLALLLRLRPHLKRVGIALGVEVRAGVQQQVAAAEALRWPLLMAAAEQLGLPSVEQLFEVRVFGGRR
jgi:hypothetical protein